MVTWEQKLEVWGYPKTYELSPVLSQIGLQQEYYKTPFELARDLRSLIDQKTRTIYVQGEWQPLAWYDPIIDFFRWLWDQIMNLLGPVVKYVGLILIGGLVMWVSPGYYKAIGAIPV
ncbi:MAG: hypothetical protein ACTSSP_07530, partial [Candidatus Asgardarchaeia archaeon]